MAKFNKQGTTPAVKTPMTTVAQTTTYEGGQAFVRDPRSELLMLAVSNMVGEDTFYEKAATRDDRFRDLVHTVACLDPQWMLGFVGWLRDGANMRSASVVAACEAVWAQLDADKKIDAQVGRSTQGDGTRRKIIAAACQRADEPGEIIAYWQSRYGRKIPKPVKRGVADAAVRLYNGKSLLKYDSDSAGLRFADVIELTHPTAADDKPWQSDLFKYAIDRRHNREGLVPPVGNKTLTARHQLMQIPAEHRKALLASDEGAERLAEAGMTWESLAGWLQGPMDKVAWEAIIPSMGAMALMRNLRNFDEQNVSDKVAAQVCEKLSTPEEIRRSRQLPYRMLSAYKAAPSLRWGHALDKALDAVCQNIPALDGRTLVLVDTSGSMTATLSGQSKVTRMEVGALFGVALATRGSAVDLYGFADGVFEHKLKKGGSVLKQTEAFVKRSGEVGHGTQIAASIAATFKPGVHKRVVIFTDMQTMGGYYSTGVSTAVPADVPMFGFNTAGYKATALDLSKPNRYEIGGFSDKMFTVMDLLSRGRDAGWPWEQ